jgi:nucleoside-diphosphate-sugar epimerase
MHEVFIVGCGDVGARVAARWQARGLPVSALARSADTTARLQGRGIRPVAGDLDEPVSLRRIAVHGMLVYHLAPPPAEGESDPRMRHWLAALDANAHRPERIVYISTTGVYGNSDGGWVTEGTPATPQTARGKRRLDAENALRAWGREHGVPVVILRVPGIYGPGRLPVAAIKERRPVVAEIEWASPTASTARTWRTSAWPPQSAAGRIPYITSATAIPAPWPATTTPSPTPWVCRAHR